MSKRNQNSSDALQMEMETSDEFSESEFQRLKKQYSDLLASHNYMKSWTRIRLSEMEVQISNIKQMLNSSLSELAQIISEQPPDVVTIDSTIDSTMESTVGNSTSRFSINFDNLNINQDKESSDDQDQ